MTPEGKIKLSIAEYLALNEKDVVFWYQPTTGIFDGIKYRKPSKFEMPGKSDIIFFVKKCPFAFWAEIKTPDGKQSADQLTFQIVVTQKLNCLYRVITSIDDMKDFLIAARKEANNYALCKKEKDC
jgi:hypothetical protein